MLLLCLSMIMSLGNDLLIYCRYTLVINFLYDIIECDYGGNMARVLISMSNDFLSKVDNIANSEQRTRSELIREALRVYIKRNKISNNLRAEENAALLSELLG